jgi:hypothetical protein
VLGEIKGHSIKCAVLSNNTMPQMSQVLRERQNDMLTAGMSTRAVAREFNDILFIYHKLPPSSF